MQGQGSTVPITSETEDLIREHWAARLIPKQYAYRPGATYTSSTHEGAIILPPPPKTMLAAWFASFRTHITKQQCEPIVGRGKPRRKRRQMTAYGTT
jgi:hypothetical protein